MGVSLGFLFANMRTRTLTDPRISHIIPSFKKESELKAVLDKFITAKWAKFDKPKSLYSIDVVGWGQAVGEAMDADAIIEKAEAEEKENEDCVGVSMVVYNRNQKKRNQVVRGLFQLHELVGDKGAFEKCHAFNHICNVVPLSAKVVAGVLHAMEGCQVAFDGDDDEERDKDISQSTTTMLRLRKIQPTSSSRSIIATKQWFWGLEKIPEGGNVKSLKRSFFEQVDLYVAAEHDFRQKFIKFLDAEGTISPDEPKAGGWYFPKDSVDMVDKERICNLPDCPKFHKVPFPKKDYVHMFDHLVDPHDYWDTEETYEQRIVRQRLEKLGYDSTCHSNSNIVNFEMVKLLGLSLNTVMKKVSAQPKKTWA